MNKYSEALKRMCELRDISEAIEKAEKYDEIMVLHESDKAINDGLVKNNKSLEQENKIKAMLGVIENDRG